MIPSLQSCTSWPFRLWPTICLTSNKTFIGACLSAYLEIPPVPIIIKLKGPFYTGCDQLLWAVVYEIITVTLWNIACFWQVSDNRDRRGSREGSAAGWGRWAVGPAASHAHSRRHQVRATQPSRLLPDLLDFCSDVFCSVSGRWRSCYAPSVRVREWTQTRYTHILCPLLMMLRWTPSDVSPSYRSSDLFALTIKNWAYYGGLWFKIIKQGNTSH